jgi:hypothetical protein
MNLIGIVFVDTEEVRRYTEPNIERAETKSSMTRGAGGETNRAILQPDMGVVIGV